MWELPFNNFIFDLEFLISDETVKSNITAVS